MADPPPQIPVPRQVPAFMVIPSPLPARHVSPSATLSSPSLGNTNIGRTSRRRRRRTVVDSAASGTNENASIPISQDKATAKPEAGENGDAGGGASHADDKLPADGSTPVTPAIPSVPEVPSYRRLYDSAMELLRSELKLEPYPIPEGLEGNCAVVGKGRNQQVKDRVISRMDGVYVLCGFVRERNISVQLAAAVLILPSLPPSSSPDRFPRSTGGCFATFVLRVVLQHLKRL